MSAKYCEYDNYRWANFNRWSDAKEVKAVVQHLIEGIASRKSDGYRITMTALVLDLYQSFLCDPEQYVAYSREWDTYEGAGSAHPFIKNHNITLDYLMGCVDHLIAEGLVEDIPGKHYFGEFAKVFDSTVSRMRPNEKLIAVVNEYGVTAEMISKFAEKDLIVLKSKTRKVKCKSNGKSRTKKANKQVKCPTNKVTTAMKAQVRQYNALLEKSHVDVDIECLDDEDRKKLIVKLAVMDMRIKRIVLRLSSKSVRRVFNNRSLEQGGRYYGAWWISAPSIVRRYITINGDATVELDFSAMHVHLLYAIKGVNYATKQEDAYTLAPGAHTLADPKDDRDLNKLILLTAFNALSPESAASAVWEEARDNNKLQDYKLTDQQPIKTRLKLLKQKHPIIASMIANDYGLKLQYYDSCIIERVVSYLTSRNIPVLTVHDSVICQVQHEELVKNTMLRCFYEVVNALLGLRTRPNQHYSRARILLSYLNTTNPYKIKGHISNFKASNSLEHKSYSGRISDTIEHNLTIKRTVRPNRCSSHCKHVARKDNNLKYMPNIKLQLVQHAEGEHITLNIR